MAKAASRLAMSFSECPPGQVRLVPVSHKMLRALDDDGLDRVACDSGVPEELQGQKFDPMERGDPVFLQRKRKHYYQPGHTGPAESEDWEPAVCISTGLGRTYESLKCPGVTWSVKRHAVGRAWSEIQVWRIPYRWRPAVLALRDTYASQAEAEAAIVTSAEALAHAV